MNAAALNFKTHESSVIDTRWQDGNILRITYKDNAEVVMKDAVSLIEFLKKAVKEVPNLKVLSLVGKHVSITPEAREYIEKATTGIKAEAIIVKALPQKIIVDFYSNIASQDHPVKIFKSEEKGLEWLQSLS